MKPKSSSPRSPHLTPERLIGRRFSRNIFNGITVAIVGYCPRPDSLDEYNPQNTTEQYFIHVPPANVQICQHNGVAFLSISHVYGGPVSAALVEELAYYGIRYILAYGLAGGLGTNQLKMGDWYIIEKALAMDGTTPHYTDDKLIESNAFLNARILELAETAGLPKFIPVQALTGDAIYREFDEELAEAKEKGCDIVNCDSSHLFAVSQAVHIQSTECGVISDVAQSQGEEWQSTLSMMLSDSSAGEEQSPMLSVGKIAAFYVEVLMPTLIRE